MLEQQIQSHFKDVSAYKIETVQALWSNYGEIARYHVPSLNKNYITKCVDLSSKVQHPRAWNTDGSHKRKISSYYNEQRFYQDFADLTNTHCRVPKCYASGADNNMIWLILEDLDASGYPHRTIEGNTDVAKRALNWLANFHSCFLQGQHELSSLWSIGTYWHLATRTDEYSSMSNTPLKGAAKQIDSRLNNASFQTLVHGDAKLANFCFSDNQDKDIAAIDFQYVGRGAGIKDVVYLLGACYTDERLFTQCDELVDYYFASLHQAISRQNIDIDAKAIEQEWRALCSFAWADFERFLQGWAPGHKKMTKYSALQCELALQQL
jgi:hypothetical protein